MRGGKVEKMEEEVDEGVTLEIWVRRRERQMIFKRNDERKDEGKEDDVKVKVVKLSHMLGKITSLYLRRS